MKKPIYEKGNLKFFISEWENRYELYEYPHSLIFPKNTYSPWEEIEFREFYEKSIQAYTLVDIYRSFELFNLSAQFKNINGDVLEVGVWRGGTAKILENSLGEFDSLYLCDTFEGVVKASIKDNFYKNGEHADTSIELVSKHFENNPNVHILKGIFPDETSKNIEQIKIKLCHIDVDVYQSAKDIFDWVNLRLIKGGVIIFDDYGFAACEGITKLVNEITLRSDYISIYNLNGHAILFKMK